MAQDMNDLRDLKMLLLYPRLAPRENPDKNAIIGGAQRIIYELSVFFIQQGAKLWLATDDNANSLVIHNLRQQGIQHLQAPLVGKTPWEFFRAYRKLSTIVSREKINLIDSHHRWTTLFGYLLSKTSPGTTFVHHAHSIFNDRLIFKRFIGENIVAVSEGVRRNLMEAFQVSPQRIRVIQNGITIEKGKTGSQTDLRTTLGLCQQDRIISIIARISRLKGHEYLIRALPKVKQTFPNIKVLFVGSEDFREPGLKEQLLRQAAALKVQDHIMFLGHRNDIASFIDLSEFLVLPSTQEGFPLVLIESQLLGKAAVASNIGGSPEIIINGLNGMIVAPRDVEGLSQAVTYLLSHPERAREMGEAGKKLANNFSMERMFQQHADYYLSLVGNQ